MKFCFGAIAGLLVTIAPFHAHATPPIIREANAIYLEELEPKPLKVKLVSAAPVYFDLAATRYAGTLRFPQVVELQAITDHAYRVKGQAQQGQVVGWIDQAHVEKLPDDLIANIRKAEERRVTVNNLIAKNEIAIGMTLEEVERSIGTPQRRTSRVDNGGAFQVWEYIKYRLVPQQTTTTGPNGYNVVSTTYIKIPIGRLTVDFKESIVQSINQVEGAVASGGQVGVVSPPIVMY